MTTFYKTVFTIEVLSEEEYPLRAELERINYDITEGHCSGIVYCTEQKQLTGRAMAEELFKQGSDPEFFELDGDGNPLE